MPNLRHAALASALLATFALAVGFALADPASDVVEASADVVAEVSNLRLLEPRYNWTPIPNGLHEPESLVEGHSVFVTLDFVGNRTPVEGEITVTGLVHCEPTARAGTSGPLARVGSIEIPYVTGVKEASLRCSVNGRVVVTPTVYCQVQGNWECGTSEAPTLIPTGASALFVSPDGQQGVIEEYAFVVTPPGEDAPRTFYAYAVPILKPWIFEDDKLARNLFAPLPMARLEEMDAWDFKVLHMDGVSHL